MGNLLIKLNRIDFDAVNKSITRDTKGAKTLKTISLVLLLIFTLGSITFYTERYFNDTKNKQISTRFKTIKRFQIPVVLIKYRNIPNGYWSVTYADWKSNDTSIEYVFEKPAKDNLHKKANNTVYIWQSYDDNYGVNISYMAIVSTYSKHLEVSDYDDGNIFLALVLNQTTTQDEKTFFLDILAQQSNYSSYMWVFERDTFENKIEYYCDYKGFNAPLVVNPAHHYDAMVEIELVVNRIKKNKPRKRIYDLSFNGASGDYTLISYTDDSIILQSKVSLSSPSFGRILKFSTTPQWGAFDVISSSGGVYSLASVVLFYIFGWIIWGTGLQYVDKYRCCGVYSHAEPEDYFNHRQAQNAILKTHIIVTQDYEGQKEDYEELIGDMEKISKSRKGSSNIIDEMMKRKDIKN